MQKKGLGERRNIVGPYRLCLTDQYLSLVKLGADDQSMDFPVSISVIVATIGSVKIFNPAYLPPLAKLY